VEQPNDNPGNFIEGEILDYEIVKVPSIDESDFLISQWDDEGDERVYELLDKHGDVIEVLASLVHRTGKSAAPFRSYEVVEIHPTDLVTEPTVVDLVGKHGVVAAIGYNASARIWNFGVVVQDGYVWCFDEPELRSTGIFLSHKQLYGTDGYVTIGRVTSEGVLIEGDADAMNAPPAPLRINLEELKGTAS
jgi:hypothetical protein